MQKFETKKKFNIKSVVCSLPGVGHAWDKDNPVASYTKEWKKPAYAIRFTAYQCKRCGMIDTEAVLYFNNKDEELKKFKNQARITLIQADTK